jgi:energy-coupling factor transporter ATP-binding protein EcfA2
MMEEENRPRKKGMPNLKLKHEREKRFWTLEDVSTRISKLAGFAAGEPDPRTVGRWERGISFPSHRYCRALCLIFQRDAQALGLILQSDDGDPEVSPPEQDIATFSSSCSAPVGIIPETPVSHEPLLSGPLPGNVPTDSLEDFPSSQVSPWGMGPSLAVEDFLPRLLEGRCRQHLLKQIRVFWISQILAQAFHYLPPLSLTLSFWPSAVVNPWQDILQESTRGARLLSPEITLDQLYAEGDGALLLLGEAGCGKSTLLLQLAEILLEHAEQDPAQPLPLVLLLSAWQASHRSFHDWLAEELEHKYEIPRDIGERWLQHGRLILLLDSLDEVANSLREQCIGSINDYRRIHPLMPMVVCCRSGDYLAHPARLHLRQAVHIAPLSKDQLAQILLEEAGPPLSVLREAFHQLPILRDFVTTPLRLSILAQSWCNLSVHDLRRAWADGSARQQFCASYVRSMLTRRGIHRDYTPQQTFAWLVKLARETQDAPIFLCVEEEPRWPVIKKVWRWYDRFVARPLARYLGRSGGQERKPCRWPCSGERTPWLHKAFLDYAVTCSLLRREEKGYGFVHKLLCDYLMQWEENQKQPEFITPFGEYMPHMREGEGVHNAGSSGERL